jgi:hypothetical protein
MGKRRLVSNHKRMERLKRISFPGTFWRVNAVNGQKTEKSLLAKNDSRLCEVVWRKLHGNFIARHDPDEMLAHFA